MSRIVPLHVQVKEYLEEIIDRGDLKPGDRLPSEKELEVKFGVSRITVRHALQVLASEEKIQRIPGKGSFLRERKVEPLTALTSFSENMRAHGRVPSYKQTRVSIIEPPPNVAAALELSLDRQVMYLRRLMLADGQPMAIQDAYLPYFIYERDPLLFTPEVLNSISMYRVLEIELGVKLYRALEQIDAALAHPDEARDLSIEEGDVVLISRRTTYDVDGKPIEYVKLVFPASRYRYKVELFRPSRPDNRWPGKEATAH